MKYEPDDPILSLNKKLCTRNLCKSDDTILKLNEGFEHENIGRHIILHN